MQVYYSISQSISRKAYIITPVIQNNDRQYRNGQINTTEFNVVTVRCIYVQLSNTNHGHSASKMPVQHPTTTR